MADDSLYLSTHEAALALVATAMKKSRLRIDTLIINSLVGGLLFTTGGMFHVMLQAYLPELYASDPGIVYLLQAAAYPFGLFYVVIMGTELFNSNILFFSVGVARGAVSIVDLIISWTVSFWFNLVANIFVCYVCCYYSDLFANEQVVKGSILLVNHKVSFSFVQTLIKGIAGNFFVALAIYLQIMVKPLHVKFAMIFLPVFTFVSMGFTHSVADMFVLIMGLINGAPHSVGKIAWKVILPGALGNMIGGSFFGIVIPWYQHLYSVEQDQKLLDLPQYDLRDEQPEINADSRVVRTKSQQQKLPDEKPRISDSTSVTNSLDEQTPPTGLYAEQDLDDGASRTTGMSAVYTAPSLRSRNTLRKLRSPKNVFPVYGMGEPLDREKSIASGYYQSSDGAIQSLHSPENDENPSAEFVGTRLKKYISRRQLNKSTDLERQPTVRVPQLRQYSISSYKSIRTDRDAYNNRMANAGISEAAMFNSDNVAGGVHSPSMSGVQLPTNTQENVSPNASEFDISDFTPNK